MHLMRRDCKLDHYRVYVPIRTVSVANLREHWSKKAKRVKAERNAVALLLRPLLRGDPAGAWVPCIVTLTRIAPRELDSDNLARSQKAVRDQVAAELGVDDRDPRITWRYEQRRGGVREYAVEIIVTRGAARPDRSDPTCCAGDRRHVHPPGPPVVAALPFARHTHHEL